MREDFCRAKLILNLWTLRSRGKTWQINAATAFGIIIFPFVAAKSNGVIISINQVGEGSMIVLFLHIYFVELSLFERCRYMYYYLWGKK